MKKSNNVLRDTLRISFITMLVCLSLTAVKAQTGLLGWDFVGEGGQSSVSAATVATGVSTSSPSTVASLGPGATAMNYLENGLTARSLTSTTLSGAIAADDYISFTITPASGKSVTITSIKLRPVSQNRQRSFSLFSSQDGFSQGDVIATITANGGYNMPLQTIAVSGHTDITTATEFRVYIYGYTDNWESGGFGNRQSGLSEEDLIIEGTVQNANPPSGTAYLSDLSWTSPPTNGWGPVEIDESNGEQGTGDGNTITLNGTTYTKGLGVHAYSDITYNLGGAYTTFISDVGVDDESGSAGSVVFEVYLDGSSSPAYQSGILTGTSATEAVNVDVSGVNQLRLVVTDGGDNNYYDHADWADARVTTDGGTQNNLTINLSSLSFSSASGTNSIAVTSNVSWTATDDRSWLSVSPGSGSNNGSVAVSVTANTGSSSRSGTVTVSGGGITRTISVSQSGTSLSSGERTYDFGINTNLLVDYNIDKPFADAMRTHRYWNNTSVDADGWPTSDGEVLVYHGLSTQNNHGTYKLYFTGSATVTSGDATVQNYQYNASANTSTADLIISNSSNSQLYISFTNTKRTSASASNTGITNVKLMRPLSPGSTQAHPADQLYTNDYMNKLAPFSTIRFMGWTNTNDGNNDVDWSTHNKWSYATVTAFGNNRANWESVILLANATNKDAWICIPHKVNDEYITRVAQMFKYGSDGSEPYTSPQANPVVPPLNSNLNLYVEYSNEIWNWGGPFDQTPWVRDEAVNYGAPLNFDGESDTVSLMYRYKAMRTVEMSNIFRDVFGDGEMPAPGKVPDQVRIRPVLCWQQAYNDLTFRTLTFMDRYYNKRDSRSSYNDPHPVNYYLYGGGGSGYWYTNQSSGVTTSNVWNLGSWNPVNYTNTLYHDATWAKAFGLSYVAYEGDNHNTAIQDEDILKQIHWDEQMYGETEEHLKAWASLEGGLFCFLVLQEDGLVQWGLYNMDEGLSGSPQYRIVQDMKGDPAEPVSNGSVIPFTRPGASFDVLSYHSPNPNGTGTLTLSGNSGSYAAGYSFRTISEGMNNVRIEYSTTGSATLDVEFDGTVVGTYNLSNTGGNTAFTSSANFSCAADRLYSIRVVVTSGSVVIHNVVVESGSGSGSRISQESGELPSKEISIYPNPAIDKLSINIPYASEGSADIVVTDLLGRPVLSKLQAFEEGKTSVELNTSALQAGVYLITIRKGELEEVRRLIIE